MSQGPADSVKPGVLMLRDVGLIVALFSPQDSSFRKGVQSDDISSW